MASVVLSTDNYTWYADDGAPETYIPTGIDLYWGSSGGVWKSNVYKSACYVNNSNGNVQIALVGSSSFSYSDYLGNYFSARLDRGYYGGAAGGWVNVGALTNPTSPFPIFDNETDFVAYITDSTPPVQPITSNGGGATHIAKVTGQLKDLSSNLSDILMVSGGGGGGYLTGVPGWDGHEIDILWSGENNKMTAQRANDVLTFKLYTSGTEIYSFNSPVADLGNINLSFASDSENQVARPAFVYYDGSSSYSYNQEAPTDEEMADIYTWLRNTPVDPVPSEYDYIKRAGTYNVRVIDANHGEHYYDLTEVPFIWNMNQLNNPFNKNLPFTLYYPGEQFYNWYYSTITSIRFYDTATINLTKESNDSYTASYTGFNYKQGISLNNGYNYVNSHGWYFESEIGVYLYVSDWSEQTQPVTMTTSFNSLGEALTYIEQHFRHVNVYVDGVCWVRAS